MEIREERAQEAAEIGRVITEAFRTAPHAAGTEAAILAGLRKAGALTLGLTAAEGGAVLGHVAFSPVRIDGEERGWFGLGPVAVRPDRHGEGIGGALIREGLARLRALGARGCVLVGDPGYYGRFGFRADPALRCAEAPAEVFLALRFGGDAAAGRVEFHPAFFAAPEAG